MSEQPTEGIDQQSLHQEARPIHEDLVEQVRVFFASENSTQRPEAGALLKLMQQGLTLDDIKEAAKRSGLENPFATPEDEEKLLQESKTIAKCLMITIAETQRRYPGATILTLSRDADPIYDVARALYPSETNIYPFPGSKIFWERYPEHIANPKSPDFDDLNKLFKFVDLLNPNRHFVILDAGFRGSIGERIKKYVLAFRETPEMTKQQLQAEIDQHIINALVYSASDTAVELPTYPYKPDEQLFPFAAKYRYQSNMHLARFNSVLADELQRLPKFHSKQKFIYTDSDNATELVQESETETDNVSQFYSESSGSNVAPINRLAAVLVQFTMLKQVMDLRDNTHWEEKVRAELEGKPQKPKSPWYNRFLPTRH